MRSTIVFWCIYPIFANHLEYSMNIIDYALQCHTYSHSGVVTHAAAQHSSALWRSTLDDLVPCFVGIGIGVIHVDASLRERSGKSKQQQISCVFMEWRL